MNNCTPKSNWVRKNSIGRGSFGVVNLAVNGSLIFAVKSVDKNSGPFVKCLENEIRILKSLSSPYVVKYLGDDVTSDSPPSSSAAVYRNLHMEYMPGGTVADAAKTDDRVKSYTRCITAALSYIHGRNIVHCDVKGKNVLVGDIPGTAKLADFGSAVELGVPVTGTRGSPLWMAPEVVRGEYQGPESDVWSLGCTVVEMLTGKPLWQDRGADTLRQIGYSDDLPELPSNLPDDLRDFLQNCLRREPSKRWSCDQLLHHPFLLSCSSPSQPQITSNHYRLSPRCAFDWCFSSSSNESTLEINQLETNNTYAKQRIGKLASNSVASWDSEGWEVVRHVMDTTSVENLESGETTSEYADTVDDEASISGSGRANWEYTESDSFMHNVESTTKNAGSTTAGWSYSYAVNRYSCYIYVLIKKLFPILFNLNFMQHIYYTHWFTSTPSFLSSQLLCA